VKNGKEKKYIPIYIYIYVARTHKYRMVSVVNPDKLLSNNKRAYHAWQCLRPRRQGPDRITCNKIRVCPPETKSRAAGSGRIGTDRRVPRDFGSVGDVLYKHYFKNNPCDSNVTFYAIENSRVVKLNFRKTPYELSHACVLFDKWSCTIHRVPPQSNILVIRRNPLSFFVNQVIGLLEKHVDI